MLVLVVVVVVCWCDVADENKVLAVKAGAIDAVTAVMKAHAGNAGVLEVAAKFLDLFPPEPVPSSVEVY